MKSPCIVSLSDKKCVISDVIQNVAEILRKGGLVILPTDTVYGVAACPDVPGAEERLYHVKKRPMNKPIALLVQDVDCVEKKCGKLDAITARLAERYWPGPVTIVIRIGAGWEGFRVPDNPLVLSILNEVGGSLRVTSANQSGQPPALTAQDAVAAFGALVELVLDTGAVPAGIPSTVVRISNGSLDVLRDGAVPADEILREYQRIAASLRY